MAKGGLGSGLDALLADNKTEAKEEIKNMRLSEIEPNKNQPRKQFDEEEIAELSRSITENGIIQPIVVRKIGSHYQIIAGERRWRASKVAGLNEIPVIVREMTDEQAAKAALVENLQRTDLNPMEEAEAYKTLMESYNLTQEQLAQTVGKSRPAVANALRLLKLPEVVRKMISDGELSFGHAKALCGLDNEVYCFELAVKSAEGLLTVRDVEKLVKEAMKESKQKKTASVNKAVNNYYTEMQLSLASRLGRRVKITGNANECKGSITIDFYDKEDLDYIGEVMSSYFEK